MMSKNELMQKSLDELDQAEQGTDMRVKELHVARAQVYAELAGARSGLSAVSTLPPR